MGRGTMDQPGGTLPEFAGSEEYYAHVADGYDLIANTYDEIEAQNVVGRRLRNRMQEVLSRSFQPGDRLLEIGCGTGIEAIALASSGVEVVATDLSEQMVTRVRAKARNQRVGNVTCRLMAAHQIGELVEEFGEASFDGAYSHAGALNMDPLLCEVRSGLGRLLRVGGQFVCTVVNLTSLFEVLFYPLVLRPRKAFRRLGNVVPIPITRLEAFNRYVVPTQFYSPAQFLEYFKDGFVLRRLEGLQIFLPPWNLSDYVEHLEPLARFVEAFEARLADKPPFNSWGSLSLLELART